VFFGLELFDGLFNGLDHLGLLLLLLGWVRLLLLLWWWLLLLFLWLRQIQRSLLLRLSNKSWSRRSLF